LRRLPPLAAVLFSCSSYGQNADAPAPAPVDAGILESGVDAGSVDATDAPNELPYRAAVLADAPIAYWPFDDDPGANTAREIVGGKNGDVVGTVTFGVPGVSGTAIERPMQTDGRLDVGDDFDFAGKVPYTIEFWVKPQIVGRFGDVLDKRDTPNGKGWIAYVHDGPGVQLEQPVPGGGRTAYVDVPSLTDGKFHHVVFTFDPTQPTSIRLRLFVDSVRTDGFSDDLDAADTTIVLTMASTYVGVLDEVALYDHALSADRVSAHYKLGSH